MKSPIEVSDVDTIARILRSGGVVAYPTEAVFGFGCDPFNQAAVARLLAIKGRAVEKGLIVVAATKDQLDDWIAPLPSEQRDSLQATWPGPITWLVPPTARVPSTIRGQHATVALRVSNHPVVAALCKRMGPLVSTSANKEGEPPCRTTEDVLAAFGRVLDGVCQGEVGRLLRPTEIRSLLTGETLRQA